MVAVAAATSLASCGAAEGENLTVDFAYQFTDVHLWHEAYLVPTLTGLRGHSPTIRITSGRLPTGLSLDGSTGRITGRPAVLESTTATLRLTVEGFEGEVSSTAQFRVLGPCTYYPFPAPSGRFWLTWSHTLSPAYVSAFASCWRPGAGETLLYEVTDGMIPEGMSLDPTSGVFSGTPVTAGAFPITLKVTASNGTSSVIDTAAAYLHIEDPLRISYADGFPAVGVPYSALPEIYAVPTTWTGATYQFIVQPWGGSTAPLPDGLSLDPGSGEISGTLSQRVDPAVLVGIKVVVTREGQSYEKLTSAWLWSQFTPP